MEQVAGAGLWAQTVREEIAAPPLAEQATADLVVVGGGYTGCSAALRASELGLSVRLLEAEAIGHGGSGRNVGLVNAGLWTPPDKIAALLGPQSGERLTARLAAAPELVFSLIERFDIACEPVRRGTLHCAPTGSGAAELRERYRQLNARGAPVTLLDAADTAARTGSERFRAALYDARAGTVQPLALCRGLARAAQSLGAALHERSPVTRVSRRNAGWRVETAQGVVEAPRLLLATNAYHRPIAGLAAPQSAPVHYFQMATEPLSADQRARILPGGEGCWDTEPVMSSFRMDGEGRLILGGCGSLDHIAAGAHRAWAGRFLARLFPALAGQPLGHAWHGRIAMTRDKLPKTIRLGKSGYAVFGYSGRGIGPGTVFGHAAAEALAGAGEEVFPLAPQDSHLEPLTALRGVGVELGVLLTHLTRR